MPISLILDHWWVPISILLDVVLVSFLVYRILLAVKGTRALPMLAGLGILVLVYVVSRKLSLVTLNWILGNFLGSVILVIVVLFQDDLRRGLIRVGLAPGLGAYVPELLEISVQEVSKAAAELVARRLGALIVIQRDVGLEEYTEHALRIDARISHQLLISIFLHSSPLHDGAVIIEGDRVVAAGAVLPLSHNPSISSSDGTRHRAAIGLSELADAVVVVVSEETGVLSLVRDGRITKDLNEKSLQNALYRLTVSRERRRQNRWKTLLGFLGRFGRSDSKKSIGETRDNEPS